MTIKILITGDAGFIGSHLKRALEKKDWLVKGFDLRRSLKEDISDFKAIKLAIDRFSPEGIIHLAAVSRVKDGFLNPLKCVDTNIGGISNILEIIREIPFLKRPWLIFGSSREVFGEPEKLPVKETDSKMPINVYGVTKLTGELLCENYSRNYGLKIRVLRFSNVYTGLNDQLDRVTPQFIIRALKNQPLIINGGEQIFDFVNIGDTIDGIIKCLGEIKSSPVLFNDFNLVTGKKTSLIELAKKIINLSGSRSQLVFKEAREYDVDKFWGDPAKSRKILNWRPKVDINAGLRAAIKELKTLL